MKVNITKYKNGLTKIKQDFVAIEEPLEIRIEGTPTAVLLRSPENDFDLVYGFLRTEGVIEESTDIQAISYVGPSELQNTIDVLLASGISLEKKQKAQRHFFASSSCGVCGKASIERIQQKYQIRPPPSDLDPNIILGLSKKMRPHQKHFESTGGIHAAALFDSVGNFISLREDIGRHNAVDKIIGMMIRQEEEDTLENSILLVSGRAGFEIVQKAMVVGIPWLVAVGAPSSLAVQLAQEGGLGLIGFLRDQHFNRYC
jgi:FdhD protein